MGAALLVVSAAVIVYSYFTNSSWLSGLLQNFGSGIVTSLLLVVLYDRILEKRAETELNARRAIGVRRLEFTLKNHVRGVLFDVCYGGLHEPPSTPISCRELVNKYLVTASTNANVLAPASSNYPSKIPLGIWVSQVFTAFRISLNNWLAAHGASATSELVDAVEFLLNSNYCRAAERFNHLVSELEKIGNGVGPVEVGDRVSISDYAHRLDSLIALVERQSGQELDEIKVGEWKRTYYAVGHARINKQS